MWHHVVLYICTNILDKHVALIVIILSWRWQKQVPITSREMVILVSPNSLLEKFLFTVGLLPSDFYQHSAQKFLLMYTNCSLTNYKPAWQQCLYSSKHCSRTKYQSCPDSRFRRMNCGALSTHNINLEKGTSYVKKQFLHHATGSTCFENK